MTGRGWVLGMAATLALAGCAGVEEPPSDDTPTPEAAGDAFAFTGVNVLPMDGDRVLSDHTVVVVDGVITALGPSASVSGLRGSVPRASSERVRPIFFGLPAAA